MKRNRLFHLFHRHCLTISAAFLPFSFIDDSVRGQASERALFLPSKAFSALSEWLTPWNKQQIHLLPLSAVSRHNPQPTSDL